jgi:hypothetical protein
MDFCNHVDARMARTRSYFLSPQKDINMRVPKEVQKCALTLAVHTDSGIQYGGTAFLVAVEGISSPDPHKYIVTAAHCLEKIGKREYALRANTRDGHSVQFGKPESWHFPGNDIAVACFTSPAGLLDLDVRCVSEKDFLTRQDIVDYKIGAGDEVFMTGLFTEVPGTQKNLPIVRMGNVALIPEEGIYFGGELIDAYLIEARSIGGLSGSPAFVSQTLMSVPYQDGERSMERYWVSGGKMFFLGLVRGHWDVLPNRSLLESEKVNMGISVVVPAEKLREVLYQPEYVKAREEAERERRRTREAVATDDSPLSDPTFTKSDFEAALKRASRKAQN